MEVESYLQIEAHDGFGPVLPHLARVFTLVVQDVSEAVVIGGKSILLFVEVSSAPSIVVNIPVYLLDVLYVET